MASKKDRLFSFTWGVLGLFTVAGLSQAKLQIVDRSATLDRARETKRFTLSRTDHARRGGIYSADDRPLAIDQDSYELGVNFRRVPKSDAFFVDLSAASGIPASDFAQLALNDSERKLWREPLSAAQRRAIQEVKTRWKADGVSVDPTGKRTYPLGEAAANVVGALMDDHIPIAGLESSQNKVLEGKDGTTVGQTDRVGEFLPMRVEAGSVPRHDGANIVVTLDSDLQQEAAAQVKAAVEKNQADNGVAIIMDPSTGDVLAMANYPTFDPTLGQEIAEPGARRSTKNPITQEQLEPGSMFKVLTLAKGLSDGKINPNSVYNCTGSKVVWAGHSIHCDAHHGNRAHGPVDAEKAIAKSCNCMAATWAQSIGYQPMTQYLLDLNLLRPTGVGLPSEAHGNFNFAEYAKPLQLATVGFGQSLTCTPIGLASAFSMLGNHGLQMKPRLIAKIGDRAIAPQPWGQRVSKEAADKTVEIMEAVIQDKSGTGFQLRIPGYTLAGKTGTAQRVNKKNGGGYVSNFVGFVPAPNPKAMILVMINHPKAGAYYGASVAGPVWASLAKSVIKRYHIPPNDPATLGKSEQINQGGAEPSVPAPNRPTARSIEPSRHADRGPVRSVPAPWVVVKVKK